ncbi:MAG: cupin domain-containing protein [Nitrospirota bacterium]|nr:cupin domain-containing protein [Nitrospirota bacterium]
MLPVVEHWDEAANGPLSGEAMRRVLAERGFAATAYVYPPGTEFPVHRHRADKLDGVLSGRLRLTMGGHSVVLEAGDLLEIPAGVEHSAAVVGTEEVVSLDGVRMPPGRE